MTWDDLLAELYRLPRNDVAAAAALFRRARESGAGRRELRHTLLLLQDDPSPLRAELRRIYVATEPGTPA